MVEYAAPVTLGIGYRCITHRMCGVVVVASLVCVANCATHLPCATRVMERCMVRTAFRTLQIDSNAFGRLYSGQRNVVVAR